MNILGGVLGGVGGLLHGIAAHGIPAVTGIVDKTINGATKGVTGTAGGLLSSVLDTAAKTLTPLGQDIGPPSASPLPATSNAGDTELDSLFRDLVLAGGGLFGALVLGRIPIIGGFLRPVVPVVTGMLMKWEHKLTHHAPAAITSALVNAPAPAAGL